MQNRVKGGVSRRSKPLDSAGKIHTAGMPEAQKIWASNMLTQLGFSGVQLRQCSCSPPTSMSVNLNQNTQSGFLPEKFVPE
jgi:hypothetical protein